jgi:hypothetical protein
MCCFFYFITVCTFLKQSYSAQTSKFVLECNILLALQSEHMLYVPTISGYTQDLWAPNVVVAHAKEGIVVIHLASGRTLCKVPPASQ